ncbi:MAG: tetratricopeptide repeat protein [Promethearchaeota archaeon]
MCSIYIRKDFALNQEEIEKLVEESKNKLEELEKFGKDSNYIKELSNLALLQIELENYTEAENNLLLCLKHFKNQRDRLGQAAVLGLLGVLFYKKDEYEKSIEFYTEAFEIYKELNQIQEEITCLKGIGNNYIKLNTLDNACEIFLECSAICSDNDDIYNLLDCLGNLIYIYEKKENWDILNELYLKSLEAFKRLKDNKGIIVTTFNLGILQKKEKKLIEALKYFKQGTDLATKSNFSELIIKGLSYVGEILFLQGQAKKAQGKFIKALHLANQVNAKNAIMQLKILLRSLGLNKEDFEEILKSNNNYK